MTPKLFPLVFGDEEQARLAELVEIDLARAPFTRLDEVDAGELGGAELLISGWGVPALGPSDLDRMPKLRAIVHWGGGAGFIDPSATDRGIVVSTARSTNAIPVAEFTLAMIVLAAKDVFWVSRDYSARQSFIDREDELPDTGLYGTTVGIVGASSIGSLVMQSLRHHDVEVLLYDPFATPERARELGAELVDDLAQLAARSRILSVHAPDLPQTRHLVSREVLAALPDGATVINTSRGALIDQAALVDELEAGRIRGILDVTDPDVLPAGHPLYTLPNVFLTPHLAGSTGSELRRLGRASLDEVERFVQGRPFATPIVP
jgi:phosphoglycerate dehydrogenase-like enzyme